MIFSLFFAVSCIELMLIISNILVKINRRIKINRVFFSNSSKRNTFESQNVLNFSRKFKNTIFLIKNTIFSEFQCTIKFDQCHIMCHIGLNNLLIFIPIHNFSFNSIKIRNLILFHCKLLINLNSFFSLLHPIYADTSQYL